MGTQSSSPGHLNLYPKISRGTQIKSAPLSSCVPQESEAGTGSTPQPWADSMAKRLFDLVIATVGAVILLPLLVLIALLIKLTSPGPALFRQQRVGKGQMPFTIYKYRTMYATSESENPGHSVTRCGDHRFTTVGPVLRRFKLDELPQLINVIRGDMSLVGPRPKLPKHERMKMICKPGITGAATIVFAQEQALLKTVPQETFEHFTVNVLNEIKAKIDKEYAETGTFRSDLVIIFATLSGFCRRKPTTNIAEILTTYGHEPMPTVTSISPRG